ncbi:MAG TPA: TonB-dependent receptor [Blastocatellia bacterium]
MILKKFFGITLSVLLALGSLSSLGLAQTAPTSRIRGTVADAQGAVVPNADVVIKNNETGQEYKIKSGDDGSFTLPSLQVSMFTVTVTAQGFKQTVVTEVKTIVGETVNVDVKLEAGVPTESVTVTSGAEVLQKETTSVGSTITGRQISDLPFTSRNALDLVLSLPGTSTPGRPRTSSVNGLPQGSLNITLDGLNVQDNLIRSGDGFFTFIRPSTDAVAEVTVSTATPGAESAGEGAVQIKFVTKSGTNQYHGTAFWENRQPNLNSNYYFNNLQGIDRTPVRLDQYGFSVGGPITPWLKDRAFFFVTYEKYRLPESTLRTAIIPSAEASSGIFRYRRADGTLTSVNLLQLAGTRNFPSTFDPIIGARLADLRASLAKGSVRDDATDPNQQQFSFTNDGGQNRYYPTMRLDFNLTSRHHLEGVWNYQGYRNTVDFLNSVDPVFPAPFPQIFGGQNSNRFSFTTALRSQITSTVVNEARFGLSGGTVTFASTISPADFAPFGGAALVLPGNYNNFFNNFTRAGSWRNTPVKQFSDNVSWSKGAHSFNFGGNYTHVTAWSNAPLNVPTVTFGIDAADPANSLFTTANFPGASPTILANAAGLYGFLVGRVTQVAQAAPLEEATGKYRLGGTLTTRNRSREFGFYGQDYYKFRPNLTINYGLRYEYQFPFEHLNGVYSFANYNSLFGVSGPGNFFKPGVLAGSAPLTPYVKFDKDSIQAYNGDKNNLAPSIGVAWSPQVKGGILSKILGEDKTVLRGGYSISYNRESLSFLSQLPGGNPGATASLNLVAGGNFTPGSLLFRNGLPVPVNPPPPVFPLAFRPTAGDQLAAFDPNIKVPYVQSWTFGIQRELDKNTVFEARYVGNHTIGIWRRFSPNEVNIFENGFLNEFNIAARNLAIARAANPLSNNYGNAGLPGQAPLPIFQASFGSATSGNFANATFANAIAQGQAGAVANLLARSTAFQANRTAAGLPANFFVINPTAITGASATGGIIAVVNGGSSTYNGLQLEMRRRLSSGLLVQGSYTFSKSLTDDFFALSNQNGGDQPRTLRDLSQDKVISPYDVRHSFKVNYIYELPFGHGHRFDYNGRAQGVVDRIIGGWATHGIIRWNSGRPIMLTSGRATFNQFESGVVLVGMDADDLQAAMKIRKDPLASTRGNVFYFPDDIIENSLKAFGIIPGTPTGRYIAPPTTPGQMGARVVFRQPSFFRADLSAVKKVPIRESMNLELRAEFLNAFNNINFFIGSPNNVTSTVAVNSALFGTTNQAYRDLSTTNDPGGRLIQLVVRFNF